MSILSVDLISPIGSGTTITLNATEVKTGTEITVGTGASIFSPAGNTLTFGTNNVERLRITNDGTFTVQTGGSERLRIDSSGRLLVGTNTYVHSQDIATFYHDSNALISVKSGGSGGSQAYAQISFKVASEAVSWIWKGGASQSSVYGGAHAWNFYHGSNSPILFSTNNGSSTAERLRIKPSGEVQIGGVDQGVNRGASSIKAVADGGGAPINVYLQEVSGSEGYGLGVDSDGDLNFYNSGATSPTLEIKDDNNIAITDGNLVVASGHGISFAATADSGGTMENELLNDYEEGTWTPVYQNVNTPNYGHRSGRYTKIGRFVYLVCQISVDSGLDTSDGSTVNIGGFPFTGNNAHGSCLFTLGQYIDVMPDSTIDLFTNVRFNGNSVLLHEGRNNQDITYTQLNSSGNLQFACSYAL